MPRNVPIFDENECLPRMFERNRHAENPLAADEPVSIQTADPVCAAAAHETRRPSELISGLQEVLTKRGITSAIAQVPLPRRDDLERTVIFFEELNGMFDRQRRSDQGVTRLQRLDYPPTRFCNRTSRNLHVRCASFLQHDPVRQVMLHATVLIEDHACWKIKFMPPDHICEIATGTDHRKAGAFRRIGERMRFHRHVHAKPRATDRPAE